MKNFFLMICKDFKINMGAYLNVNTTCEKVRADQVSAKAGAEIMEHAVSVRLSHFGMNVITTVAQFCNLLGQQFYSLSRVTENYTLVDL